MSLASCLRDLPLGKPHNMIVKKWLAGITILLLLYCRAYGLQIMLLVLAIPYPLPPVVFVLVIIMIHVGWSLRIRFVLYREKLE